MSPYRGEASIGSMGSADNIVGEWAGKESTAAITSIFVVYPIVGTINTRYA